MTVNASPSDSQINEIFRNLAPQEQSIVKSSLADPMKERANSILRLYFPGQDVESVRSALKDMR